LYAETSGVNPHMRHSLAALLAAAALCAAANNASACQAFGCYDYAVGDDLYPPGDPVLPPPIEAAVRARQGFGLSQAGFYNEPRLPAGIRARY
jgi:L-alanine-DL-glutamate epimerase-like enolase superfamily enzyme